MKNTIKNAIEILNDDQFIDGFINKNGAVLKAKKELKIGKEALIVAMREIAKTGEYEPIRKRLDSLQKGKDNAKTKETKAPFGDKIKVYQDALRRATNETAKKNGLWDENFTLYCSTKGNNGKMHVYSDNHAVAGDDESKKTDTKSITWQDVWDFCIDYVKKDQFGELVNAMDNKFKKNLENNVKVKQVA